MGRAHLRAAQEQAVAVVEPLARVRDGLEARGLRAYPSVEALLDAGGVDAAIVAAPTTLHRAVVEPLLDAGLPVLCEKPCCIDVDDTRALATLAERRGVVLQVGYWRRFVPDLLRLHDDIHSGRLGPLSLVICQQWDERPPPASFRRQSGGIAIDMGVHEFDQLRWLTGQEIGRLAAAASTVGVDPPSPATPRASSYSPPYRAARSRWCRWVAGSRLEICAASRSSARKDSRTARSSGRPRVIECSWRRCGHSWTRSRLRPLAASAGAPRPPTRPRLCSRPGAPPRPCALRRLGSNRSRILDPKSIEPPCWPMGRAASDRLGRPWGFGGSGSDSKRFVNDPGLTGNRALPTAWHQTTAPAGPGGAHAGC
jgi:hypothetical protein